MHRRFVQKTCNPSTSLAIQLPPESRRMLSLVQSVSFRKGTFRIGCILNAANFPCNQQLGPWLGQSRGAKIRVIRPASLKPLAATGISASEYFFASEDVSFTSLGVCKEVDHALQAAGYVRPTRIQVRQGGRMQTGHPNSISYQYMTTAVHVASCGSGSSAEYVRMRGVGGGRGRREG